MDEIKIFDDLYMFRSGGGNIPITFNQFLLTGAEPLLIHTGNNDHASALIPKLKDILGNRTLSYIFISHFEGDECGGLSLVMSHFPKAIPVCSSITARQLKGFGFDYNVMIKSPDDKLQTEDYNLQFISYPSEMHLWEGLLAFETNRGLLFSSDLFIQMDKVNEITMSANPKDEIKKITHHHVPSPAACEALQQKLLSLPVKVIVPGHGPVLMP